MAARKTNKQRYNFLIDRDVYEDFSLICDELGLVRSKNLELYMRDLVEKNKEVVEKRKR
ncbi:hypothetical protein HN419_07220 [Candidatus Woesearchaeota archaeon]|jgi:hypothetical protein|nr:hypothetical protein [Candidatus Woesearchaeota archaeon]MBT3538283.1 hypothetical protein [Candidatus Woesearchaeota archaeon]MBT4698182.1 hypothetical protein [Candidatus Woesearchaeota archaeon]MBT4716841.1 hypothetical protein [Candidatus Woesearchaeota archaeon]MBT7105952.1 hypothetical protein [Candidatus Woesearchaeota archaeon]